MDGPDMDDLMDNIEALQPGAGASQAPAGAIMRAYIPQPREVQLRHLSPSDPDGRVRSVEKTLRQKFEAQWSDKSNQAYVSDVFLIEHYGATAMKHQADYEAYSIDRQSYMPPGQSAVTRNFHGTTRLCDTGEISTHVKLCNIPNCGLCSIMRTSFQLKYVGTSAGTWFGKGLYSSPDSFKASKYEHSNGRGTHKHTILLCSVVTGRKEQLFKGDPSRTWPSNGFDSIEAVPNAAGGIRWFETVVFREKAIMPHALITYDFKTHNPRGPSQTITDGSIYTITNKEFGTALDMNANDDRVIGWRQNGRDNQQWVFRQQATGGWMLQNKADNTKYLGLVPKSTSNKTACNGVSYTDAVVWEIQPSSGGTYRIAMYDTLSKCLDLSKHDGNKSPGKIWIWDHLKGGENQRWNFKYIGQDTSGPGPSASQPAGQKGPTQTPVDGGVYIITNDLFDNTGLDLNDRNNDVQGWRKNGKPNQHWVFSQSGGGWQIYSEANNMYLGLRNSTSRSKGNMTKATNSPDVTWDIQPAYKGSVRIAPLDVAQSMCLDMNKSNKNQIVLWTRTPNAKQQRWYLQRVS